MRHRPKLHSTSPLERLNKEVKRRANVVGIFRRAHPCQMAYNRVGVSRSQELNKRRSGRINLAQFVPFNWACASPRPLHQPPLITTVSMLALSLAAAFCIYWALIGFAAIRLLGFRRDALRDALLAPSVGLCLTLLPTYLLNRNGSPVPSFAIWQTIATLACAAGAMAWCGEIPPRKWLAAFVGVAMLGLLAVSWPLLTHGFDWLANANDDMANYVLGAERFARFGFFDAPNPADILPITRDATQWYWFLQVVSGVRPGSELLLAWALSVAGLSGVAVFMPVIAALHVTLLCAAAGLVMVTPEQRRAALLTAILMSVNPMTALGNLFQLIAQDFGLS